MKISNVPMVSYRFYPKLTRTLSNEGKNVRDLAGKFAIMSGNFPTDEEVLDIVNYEQFLTDNSARVHYSSESTFSWSWDGAQQKRTVQKYPVGADQITVVNDPVPADSGRATKTGLWLIFKTASIDTSENVANNDLIVVTPNVGLEFDDFCSISDINFSDGDEINLNNITLSIFQGYQDSDEQIVEEIDDPDNPGNKIDKVIGTKKSLYFNKVFLKILSESYRNLLMHTNTDTKAKYLNMSGIKLFGSTLTPEPDVRYPILVNESFMELLKLVNNDIIRGTFKGFSKGLNNTVYGDDNFEPILKTSVDNKDMYPIFKEADDKFGIIQLFLPFLLRHNLSLTRTLLVDHCGYDAGLVDRALPCRIPLSMLQSNITTEYQADSRALVFKHEKPIQLHKRYKQSVDNPFNEKLYIVFPRMFDYGDVSDIDLGDAIDYVTYSIGKNTPVFMKTQDVLDNKTEQTANYISLIDYTAFSIGETGAGNVDIEINGIDTIDYIDSLTIMIKLPNKH